MESGRGGSTQRRLTVAAVVALLVLLIPVLVLGALSPSRTVFDGPGFGRPEPTETSTTATPLPGEAPDQPDVLRRQSDWSPDIPEWLVKFTVLTTVFVGVALLLWFAWRRRPVVTRTPERAEVDFELLAEAELRANLARGAKESLELLAEGTPRNAIVACWSRFETLAGEAGARPEPWETSTDFSERVLARLGADGDAVRDLAALFRLARFGADPVSEADRERAGALLARVADSLGSVAG